MTDLVLKCTLTSPSSTLAGRNLVCRFDNDYTVPAQYSEEDQTVCCKVPGAKLGNENGTAPLTYDVVEMTTQELLLSKQGVNTSAAQGNVLFSDTKYTALPINGQEPAPPPRRTLRERYDSLAPFVIISTSYLLFTMTDGAIRMIVLLYAYQKGFSAMEVAIMFSFYELAGVFTNFLAGVAGARWGIKSTLLVGLFLQLAGIGMLFGWKDEWSKLEAIIYVTAAQSLCGVAKDLTKLGGKTVAKLVTSDDKQTSLFKLVAVITGFKNSLKGVGYFIGSALLTVSLEVALGVLMALIALAMPWAVFGLSSKLGRTRKENIKVNDIFKKNYNVNVLSLSRIFLFGCRDLWFEVPLPFFMRDTVYGLGWARTLVGAALAIFIIVYGQVQSWTPQLVSKPLRQSPPNKYVAALWCYLLSPIPMFLGLMLPFSGFFEANQPSGPRSATLMPPVGLFSVIFAVNSSVHSYLIVRYTEGDKVAMNVGFYYMSNAVGRLVGTLASGAIYSYVGANVAIGLAVCFWASLAFSLTSAIVDGFLHDEEGGLNCGPCLGPYFLRPLDVDAADAVREVSGTGDEAANDGKGVGQCAAPVSSDGVELQASRESVVESQAVSMDAPKLAQMPQATTT